MTGRKAPKLELTGILSGKRSTFRIEPGSWTVVLFYPADFSFVCPTEVTGFSAAAKEFEGAGARLLGVSADTIETHEEWSQELGGVSFPLLADPTGETIARWGATDPDDKVRAVRATFIVDPAGVIVYAVASHRNVGRSVQETLRVVKALQTGRMCPADWKPGQPTVG